MADTHETIDDIIAEKRRRAEHIRNNLSTVPFRRWDQQAEIKSLEDEADRLDAAHKREVAALQAQVDELRLGIEQYPLAFVKRKQHLSHTHKGGNAHTARQNCRMRLR